MPAKVRVAATSAAGAVQLPATDARMLGAPRQGHDDAPHLGTGAYALDQSWHAAWLFAAALVASIGAA